MTYSRMTSAAPRAAASGRSPTHCPNAAVRTAPRPRRHQRRSACTTSACLPPSPPAPPHLAAAHAAVARHEATRSSQAGTTTSPGFEDVVPLQGDDCDTSVGDNDCSSASPPIPLDDDAAVLVPDEGRHRWFCLGVHCPLRRPSRRCFRDRFSINFFICDPATIRSIGGRIAAIIDFCERHIVVATARIAFTVRFDPIRPKSLRWEIPPPVLRFSTTLHS